jgi:predicted site-specific integrase-resolvase
MDMLTLCRHICVSTTTVDNWVAQGILPPPRKRGGKLMWKWSEVDKKLTDGQDDEKSELERIRDGTRRAAQAATGH